MQNIDKQVVAQMKHNAEALYALYNEADAWVNKHLTYEEKENTSLKLKDGRRIIRKIKNSLESKPVFALFGASQVGKSYLVKNLLSVDGAPLTITLGDVKYDFLKEINPPGVGAESTGVVTRFSIDHTYTNPDFPIRIKLLDPKDLVIILCDSFFSDLKKIDGYATTEQFKSHCENLEIRFSNKQHCQQVLIEDDIMDIQDYFNTHFFKHQHILECIEKSSFWLRICRIINKIPYQDWTEVFSILWGKNSYLNQLFTTLIEELQKLNFNYLVYAAKESVLRGHGEILDVQRLKEILTGKQRLNTLLPDGSVVELSLCKLSALSAELTLSIDPQASTEKPFLKNTDLLDFPGARSRLELDAAFLSEDSVPDMLLRGKVAYLFNKYSGDFEINNLLFCQNDKQLDVNEIPSLLHEWISKNIGRTPEEREKSIRDLPVSPLFVVFTFFNNQLKYDTTNDDKEDIGYKWNNRFVRFFEQEVVTSSYNWHLNWTNSNSVFKNFYLLRDYKYSDDTFHGFSSEQSEIGIRPDRIEFMDKLKQSFLHFPFVSKHFDNAEKSWSAAASPNQDGSQLIIKNLEPAANNYVKMMNYTTQLESQRISMEHRMKKYYHSDNLQEKRIAAIKKANELQIELNRLFGRNPVLYSVFLNKIILTESEVYNYFHENISSASSVETFDEYTLFRAQFPRLKSENSRETNIEILREELFYSTAGEVEQFLSDSNVDLDKVFSNKINTSASSLVEGLFDLWRAKIKYEKFEELTTAGLSRKAFNDLLEVLETTIDHLGLVDFLTKLVEKKTNRIQIGREAEEYLAAVCANYLNDFVVNIGFNFMSDNRLEELQQVSATYHLNINSLLANKSEPTKADLVSVFTAANSTDAHDGDFAPMIESYNRFVLKIKLALLSNCGFVNYDVAANDHLSKMIQSSASLRFNID